MHSLQAERRRAEVCGRCISNRQRFDSVARYESVAIEAFLSPDDISQAVSHVQRLSPDELVNFSRDGIALGKFWTYDLCLAKQSADAYLDSNNIPALRDIARAGLLAFEAARQIFARKAPTALIVFSREYAVNRSFSAYFESRDCEVFNIHPRGPSFSRFYSFSVSKSDRADNALADNKLRESMLSAATRSELKLIAKHLSSAIYPIETDRRLHFSIPKNNFTSKQVRSKLKLSDSAPVVTVLMSSPDEAEAAVFGEMYPLSFGEPRDEHHLSTILSLAGEMPNIQFVFRWHPRGFPKGIPSPDTRRILETTFSDTKSRSNIFMNFPADNLSLYDLAKITDLALSYRSTAAWDYGALGIPVVQLDPAHDPATFMNRKAREWNHNLPLRERVLSGLLVDEPIEVALPYVRLYVSAFLRLNTPIRAVGRKKYAGANWWARSENQKLKKILGLLRPQESAEYLFTFSIGQRWRSSGVPASQILREWAEWLQPLGVARELEEKVLISQFQQEIWNMLGPFDGLESSPAKNYRKRHPKARIHSGVAYRGP